MALRTELFDVLRAYASLKPLRKASWPEHLDFEAIHAFFLENIFLSPHFMQYPPSAQYQATFWKWVIHHLESMTTEEDEIDSRIYEHYLTLLPSSGLSIGDAQAENLDELCPRGLPLAKPPAPSYITHYWKPAQTPQGSGSISLQDYETVTLLESRTTIESGTTGMRTWLASFVLSDFFTEHPDLIKNKRILELGSGVGFLGIILRRLQEFISGGDSSQCPALWLTDVNESVLSRCQENLHMPCNKISSFNVHYRFLDWTDSQNEDRVASLKSLLVDEVDADLIVGADIIFDPSLIPALTGVLHLALQPGRRGTSKSALIAATIRSEETFGLFSEALQKENLEVHEFPVYQNTSFIQDIDNNHENVKIFKITL